MRTAGYSVRALWLMAVLATIVAGEAPPVPGKVLWSLDLAVPLTSESS